MRDDEPVGADEMQAGAACDAVGVVERTAEHLARMESEWRHLRRAYANHPVVTITPVQDDAAAFSAEFQIDYRLRTMALDEAGEVQFLNEASLHVWLAPGFPQEPPLVRPIGKLFHPNLADAGMNLESIWRKDDSLAALVAQIGEILMFRKIDQVGAVNAAALSWALQNPALLPTDADVFPDNASAVRDALAELDAALKRVMGLVQKPIAGSPATVAAMIPPLAVLEPLQKKISQSVADLMRYVNEPRAAQDGVIAATVREAESKFRECRADIAAFEQLVSWRQYMDLFVAGRSLEKQILEWGSAGLQAFFLANASGTFGPFQFQEQIDLGGTLIAVRSDRPGRIEVLDAGSQKILGDSVKGAVSLLLGKREGFAGHPTQFRLTGNCAALAAQLELVQTRATEAIAKLQRPVTGASGWCAATCAVLADAHQQQNLRDAHRKTNHRWKNLISDLRRLGKFKDRLATYHLIERISEHLPLLIAELAPANARWPASAAVAKAPDNATQYFEPVEKSKQEMVRQLSERLSNSQLTGSDALPPPRVLDRLPEALENLKPMINDAALARLLAPIEAALGVELPVKLQTAADEKSPSRAEASPISASAASLDFPEEFTSQIASLSVASPPDQGADESTAAPP